MSNKRKYLIIIGLMITILSVIGLSYAYWMFTTNQTDRNKITSKCFEVTMSNDSNGITLNDAHPVMDEEGKEQVGYKFTITNTCDTLAYYQVNLEELALDNQTKRLDSKYIKVSLNDSNGKILSEYSEVDPTIKEEEIKSDKSHKLTSGSLEPNKAQTYTLKLWMADSTPALDETMDATFKSKVSVIASYKEESELENTILVDYIEPDGYSKESEKIEVDVTSNNFNIIEYSFDKKIWNPVEKPEQTIKIEKIYEEEGTYFIYFKDEVGNIMDKEIHTNKLDQTGPETEIVESSDSNGAVLNITFNDEKSGLKAYKIEDEVSTIDLEDEWKEFTEEHTETITFHSNINKNIHILVKDQLENESTKNFTITKADTKGPIIEVTSTKEDAWTNESVTITINATDDISGVDKFYYRKKTDTDEEEWLEIDSESVNIEEKNGNASITFDNNINETYEFKVTDKMNNVSEIKTSKVKIDKASPSQSFSILPNSPNGSNNWYNTSPTVTITGSDEGGSNIVSGKYCTGTGDCTPNEEFNGLIKEVTLPNGKEVKVCATFKDNAENESKVTCSSSYNIDNEDPTQSFGIEKSKAGTQGSGWYQELTLKVTTSDNHSGVSSAKYCISKDGTICNPNVTANLSSNTFNVALGTDANAQKVCVNVTDVSGRTSSTSCSSSYSVDNSPPTFKANLAKGSVAKTLTASATNLSETGSGNVTYTYSLNNAQAVAGGATYTYNDQKRGNSYTVKITATDKAGNSTTQTSGACYLEGTIIEVLSDMSKVTSGNGLYSEAHSGVTGTTNNSGFTKTEYRYAGLSPYNYITFNNEKWRIIGLVNVTTTSNTVEQKIKIIRDTPYYRDVVWGTTTDWSKASLPKNLNSDFYNKLQSDAKNMIDTVKWNLGACGNYASDYVAKLLYNCERGNKVISGHQVTYSNNVGLIYPSDFVYATSGGSTYNRTKCLEKYAGFSGWTGTYEKDCGKNDWLYDGTNIQWTATNVITGESKNSIFVVDYVIDPLDYDLPYAVARPTVYLKNSVKIKSGNGSSSTPYTLSLT